MNRVQELMMELRAKGWTVAAIADEVGVFRDTASRWGRGVTQPTNIIPVVLALETLLQRKRIPKRKRYTTQRRHLTPDSRR